MRRLSANDFVRLTRLQTWNVKQFAAIICRIEPSSFSGEYNLDEDDRANFKGVKLFVKAHHPEESLSHMRKTPADWIEWAASVELRMEPEVLTWIQDAFDAPQKSRKPTVRELEAMRDQQAVNAALMHDIRFQLEEERSKSAAMMQDLAMATREAALRRKSEKPERQSKPRSDREQNLLRVIAGLWALSGLPPEHNTAADRLEGLFDGWGREKPGKAAIADTILKEAAKLPRIIRKSDGKV